MGTQVHGGHTLAIMPNVDYAFIVALVVVILDGINADDDEDDFSDGFINGIDSYVNMVEAVNILQFFTKYQWFLIVGVDVSDSGICSKYFSTLCKIPTDYIRLEICRL
jgi:hypothetical protein